MRFIFSLVLAVCLSVSLVGCGLWNDDSDDPAPAVPGSVKGPSGTTAFNSVSISLNPTISFSGSTFSYANAVGDQSTFPIASTTSLSGTFSYVPGSDFSTGLLTLDFDHPSFADMALSLSGFQGYSTGITTFKATYNGVPYDVKVQSGSFLPTSSTSTSTSTSTATSTGTSTSTTTATSSTTGTTTGTTTTSSTSTGTGATGGTSATIPASLQGQTKTLPLTFKATQAPSSFPYKVGDTEQFVFSSSSMLFVGKSSPQRDLGTPQQYGNSLEYWWFDSTNNFYYVLSLKSDGSFNEINVNTKPQGGTFYGQFSSN